MLTFEQFEDYLFEAAEQIPKEYYTELNGGIMAREECKIHPDSRGEELCIMGQYCRNHNLGRYIVLYYGSFVHQYSGMPDGYWKSEIKKVLEHELTHHLESLAGEKDLEIDDKIQLMQYLQRPDKKAD